MMNEINVFDELSSRIAAELTIKGGMDFRSLSSSIDYIMYDTISRKFNDVTLKRIFGTVVDELKDER